jgi:hypothetical protein
MHTPIHEVLLKRARHTVPHVGQSNRKELSGLNGGGIERTFGYARISHDDDLGNALQTKALRATGCSRIFLDKASGGRWDRPELHRLLDGLRKGTPSSS